MKKIFFLAVCFAVSMYSFAQSESSAKQKKLAKQMKPAFGIKGGYNIARITGSTPDWKPDPKDGFMVSAFFAPKSKSGLGYRTELIFSRQGFAFDANNNKQQVRNDYIYMPHFTTFGITKFIQLHLGVQIGYLLKSTQTNSSDSSKDISDFYNRLDYGAAGGVEIYPIKNIILGARYNVSFGSLYKHYEEQASNPMPFPLPFNPNDVKNRNAVINIYAGIRF